MTTSIDKILGEYDRVQFKTTIHSYFEKALEAYGQERYEEGIVDAITKIELDVTNKRAIDGYKAALLKWIEENKKDTEIEFGTYEENEFVLTEDLISFIKQ
jgi:methionine salvage enolase-phosphatase E1